MQADLIALTWVGVAWAVTGIAANAYVLYRVWKDKDE